MEGLYQAGCQSCGARATFPDVQPLPRCRHCWAPMVRLTPIDSASLSDQRDVSSKDHWREPNGRPAGRVLDADPSPPGKVTCDWCAMFVDPATLCAHCGAPMPALA